MKGSKELGIIGGIIAPNDLEAFREGTEKANQFREAVEALIGLADRRPDNGYPDGVLSRFALCEFAKSAAGYRAGFRILDTLRALLWADYLACENGSLAEWRGDVAAVEALQTGDTPEGNA